MKIRKFPFLITIFFLLYFLTYIDEKTILKYLDICFLQLALLLFYKKMDIKKLPLDLKVILLLIFTSLIISLLFNFSISAMIKVFSVIDLYILTFFFLSKTILNNKISTYKLYSIISNTLFITLIVSFIFKYNDSFVAVGRSSTVSIRHVFGFVYPSIVGVLCFVEFALSFYLLTQTKHKSFDRIFCYLKIFISIDMVRLANIRSAIVTMILFIILYYFEKMTRNMKNSRIRYSVHIIIILIGVFFTLGISFNLEKLNYILSDRFVYYQEAIAQLKDSNSILFGLGAFRNSDVVRLNRVQVDNSYLDYVYQYGLIPLMFMCAMLIYLFIKINKSYNFGKTTNIEYYSFVKSLYISSLVYSLVEKNLFSISSTLSLIMFLIVFIFIVNDKRYVRR